MSSSTPYDSLLTSLDSITDHTEYPGTAEDPIPPSGTGNSVVIMRIAVVWLAQLT
jgi:hypothetical protein